MDNIYAHKKTVDGREMIPQMYGDPRGYGHTGAPEWYHWTPNLQTDRLTEIYLWSMNRKDLERVPKKGWIGFLEGQDAAYPAKALAEDLEFVRGKVEAIRTDPTSADTRLADYLLNFSPAATDELTKLMLGGYFTGRIWVLHSRLRYFDPEKRRSGVPENVGALVEKLAEDSVTVTLVNTNQVVPRTVMVQAGGYAEHQFASAMVNGKTVPIDNAYVTVRLAPGSGARVEFQMKRYSNRPSLAQPWDRGWMVKR
jgi:hypothetical protein